jgi:hypothetical protein
MSCKVRAGVHMGWCVWLMLWSVGGSGVVEHVRIPVCASRCTHVCLGDAWVGWVTTPAWWVHSNILPDHAEVNVDGCAAESRGTPAKEMAERTDRQCPSVEQVPNESFWAAQPGSHNLPPDVETEHCVRLVANHCFGL